ncbi:hypothetical protein ACFPOI_45710 [Nonomuraea angiospora]|uniref:Uncharacterized protein n=1 Tax=Nonomuraea angiospora TaxID=46172 RepID=A0ABR9LZ38_9ACTN|nr:hypothetical protein [Nonomuraea angiospora]MBE1585886.1 hypothetical protein [Nonomuraea angiospora]
MVSIESNLIVWALGNHGRTKGLLVNKIGDYRGRVVLPAGTRCATIQARGKRPRSSALLAK